MDMHPNDSFLMRSATPIALSALTLLTVLAGGMFWHQEMASRQAKQWVVHTQEIIGHLELLSNNLKDAELGKRGYILTGSENFLDPYEDALRDAPAPSESLQQHRSIKQELAVIRKLTADNPEEQSNLDEMDVYVQKLLDFMAAAIEKKRELRDKTAIPKVDFQYGKEQMDHVRGLIRIMTAEELHLLALRTEADEINTHQNEWIAWSIFGFFYLSMMLSVWIYQRARTRAAAQLLHYTQQLERNEEELKQQQEELKASNEEIEASNEELEEKTKALEEQNAQVQQQSKELQENKRLIEEKAREVERASKYKSEFLANMSHELRTPLNSLLILAKLLAANETGNLTTEQVEELNAIHTGGLELLGLINDILDLSKVEAGKLTIVPENISLDDILSRMQQQFLPVAKDRGLDFPIRTGSGLPSVLFTDVQRVEQILKNLLSNAFKFTERGSVTLEVSIPEKETLQRASLNSADTIAFAVIDTGIGIEPSKFKDIFEAFQQEDGSIDRHYGGTGLGLTIARKFAHMLGGEIRVESIKNQGSIFTLVLPIKYAPKEDEQETEQAGLENPPVTTVVKSAPRISGVEFVADDRNIISDKDKVLLIIEDDPSFASTLMKLAHRRGYKCLIAGNGKSGLLLAADAPVTAIILDMGLPDMDGMNVLDQLKHNLETRHIPVHIISGVEPTGAVLPLRKGAIGYLTKPAEKEAIDGVFNKIEKLLEAEVKHILVIEDDKPTQMAVTNLLKKNDVHITIASTGREATQQMQKTQFDCIVLDLQLPDTTGFKWLEGMEAFGLPPVVVYTARELSEAENRKLNRYTGSIVVKGAKSPERLLDEVTLFLHSVESSLSADQQAIIRMQHNPDNVLKGKTILLTDDDMRNTFALSKLLKSHGMNIIIADNGQMALEKLNKEPAIDLIIMDVMMPVMDGYQAMQAIRNQQAWSDLPIIALTARAMPEDQEKCIAAGANDYMTKPVDIERLLTLLRVWLFRQEKAA